MTEDTQNTEEQSTEEAATALAEPKHEEHTAEPFDDHFRPADIDGFTADDTVAGSAIGKMLAILFLYTVLAMTLTTWWTFMQGE